MDKAEVGEVVKKLGGLSQFVHFSDYNPTIEDLVSGKIYANLVYKSVVSKAESINK